MVVKWKALVKKFQFKIRTQASNRHSDKNMDTIVKAFSFKHNEDLRGYYSYGHIDKSKFVKKILECVKVDIDPNDVLHLYGKWSEVGNDLVFCLSHTGMTPVTVVLVENGSW
jgi:hypothetical protein